MVGFEELLKSFKSRMYPFNILKDKEKKRVLSKFGQFYEKKKDYVKELNDKQKEYDKK